MGKSKPKKKSGNSTAALIQELCKTVTAILGTLTAILNFINAAK